MAVLRTVRSGSAAMQQGTALSDENVPKPSMTSRRRCESARARRECCGRNGRPDAVLLSDRSDARHPSAGRSSARCEGPPREAGRALAEAAYLTGRWRKPCVMKSKTLDERSVYDEIDLPLVPVLPRMEKEGVRIDSRCAVQNGGGAVEGDGRLKAKKFTLAGQRFNINSPKQLGDVLFNKMGLPRPLKYGKGKMISTAAMYWRNWRSQRCPAAGAGVPATGEAEVQLRGFPSAC